MKYQTYRFHVYVKVINFDKMLIHVPELISFYIWKSDTFSPGEIFVQKFKTSFKIRDICAFSVQYAIIGIIHLFHV